MKKIKKFKEEGRSTSEVENRTPEIEVKQRGTALPRSQRGLCALMSIYGGLHQKFWTQSRPTSQLMGQNPKELPKAHSHAHAKAMILWKTAAVKRE